MSIKKHTLIFTIATIAFLLSGCDFKNPTFTSESFTPVPKPEMREDAVVEIGKIDPQIDAQLQSLLDEGGIPSFTVGIVIEDELVWAKSYNGFAGVDTVYSIGSVTKPFVATAVLQLYEKGLIDLDADINDYLPFAVHHPKYADETVTVRMIMTHQSGLNYQTNAVTSFHNPDDANYHFTKAVAGLNLPELNLNPYPTSEEFFKSLLIPGGDYYTNDVWVAKPGNYIYSNIGYDLLAYLIECVTDEPVDTYLQKNILSPLVMNKSGVKLTELASFHALPHLRIQGDYIRIQYQGIPFYRFCTLTELSCIIRNLTQPGGYIPVPDSVHEKLESGYIRFPLTDSVIGGSGLRSSVPDLASFMITHMNEGRAPNGYQLLEAKTVAMMHQVASKDEGSINMIPLIGYGMGWTIAKQGIQGHIGGDFGFESEMLYRETSKGLVGIIFLRNWSWNLADDYDNGFEYWKKYHVGVREILFDAAEMMADQTLIND